MTSGVPIEMVWDGEAMRPVSPYWLRRADKEFVRGEIYRIVDQPERSHKSHAHFFAAINEVITNLYVAITRNYRTGYTYCISPDFKMNIRSVVNIQVIDRSDV